MLARDLFLTWAVRNIIRLRAIWLSSILCFIRTNIRVGQQGLVAFISETFPEKVGVKFEGNCNKKTAATGKKSEGTVSICHG
jgi:hypothetical protein